MSIPRAFIDELIVRTDVVELIDSYVSLRKAGKDYQACCPFHQEKTPSFTVSREKQFYYCFGCQATGNAISFLMDYGHLEFIEAIHELADRLGLDVPDDKTDTAKPSYQQQTKPLYQLLEHVAHYYHQQLQQKNHSKVQAYLHKRGISPDTAAYFNLGYAPKGWDNLLQQFPQQQDLLMQAGLLSNKNSDRVYDRFRERLIFPIHDHRGRVIALGGRVLDDSKPKYLNSPESPVFHKSDILYGLDLAKKQQATSLLVVEGYMDVVALQQYGYPYAVATLGTAATDAHFKQIFRTVNKVIFCFDGDKAGKKAAWRVLDTILPHVYGQHQVQFLFLPDGEDPDSLVQAQGLAGFEAQLNQTVALSQVLFERLAAQADMEQPDWQGRLFALTKPLLETMPAGTVRDFFIDKLGEIDPRNVSQSLPQSGQKNIDRLQQLQRHQHHSEQQKQHRIDVQISPMRMVITLLLQQPHLRESIDNLDAITRLQMPGAPLLQSLLDFIALNPHTNSGSIIEHWRGTESAKHLSRLLTAEHHLSDEQQQIEFTAALNRLLEQQRNQQLDELLQKSRITPLSEAEKQTLRQLLAQKTRS